MKTKEELNAIKEEIENLNMKLAELSEEELEQVSGGKLPQIVPDEKFVMKTEGSIWNPKKLPTEPGNYRVGLDIEIKDKLRPYK